MNGRQTHCSRGDDHWEYLLYQHANPALSQSAYTFVLSKSDYTFVLSKSDMRSV